MHLLTNVYDNWQQNGKNAQICELEVVTLIRKDPNKGGIISNFQPTTLLNKELKVLAKVLTQILKRVVERLAG